MYNQQQQQQNEKRRILNSHLMGYKPYWNKLVSIYDIRNFEMSDMMQRVDCMTVYLQSNREFNNQNYLQFKEGKLYNKLKPNDLIKTLWGSPYFPNVKFEQLNNCFMMAIYNDSAPDKTDISFVTKRQVFDLLGIEYQIKETEARYKLVQLYTAMLYEDFTGIEKIVGDNLLLQELTLFCDNDVKTFITFLSVFEEILKR